MLTDQQKTDLAKLLNSFNSPTLAQDVLSVMEDSAVAVHYYTIHDVYCAFDNLGKRFVKKLTREQEDNFMMEISRYYPSEWTDFLDTIRAIATEMKLPLEDVDVI